MNNSTHLGDELQTTCTHCGSVFRIHSEQLDAARGRVRCSQCMQVFNALIKLENYNGQPIIQNTRAEPLDAHAIEPTLEAETDQATDIDAPSLREAMYGGDHQPGNAFKPVLWIVGILMLLILLMIQVIYYQRYELISDSRYQQQILSLCQFLPCDRSRFSNPAQIRMVERNVFSHPTHEKALMITGSFINDAPFEQPMPALLVSLSDINGNLIANREFSAQEYLTNKSQHTLAAGKSAQFRLEILDPGTEALTYEFEFKS
jgi:predicted Zn finger-like uncharacterized protein